jgi:hypothetical protein
MSQIDDARELLNQAKSADGSNLPAVAKLIEAVEVLLAKLEADENYEWERRQGDDL